MYQNTFNNYVLDLFSFMTKEGSGQLVWCEFRSIENIGRNIIKQPVKKGKLFRQQYRFLQSCYTIYLACVAALKEI